MSLSLVREPFSRLITRLAMIGFLWRPVPGHPEFHIC
jgi:hypothetical protein